MAQVLAGPSTERRPFCRIYLGGGAEVIWHLCVATLSSARMWFRVELTQSGLYEGRAYKFTASDPDNRLGGGCPCLGFDVSVFHPSSVPPQVNWMCKGQVHSGGGSTIAFGECQREVFSPRHGQPAAPRGCSSVYAKGVQLLKNRVVDGVKLCAAYADLKQNHAQLPFLHEIHLYTVKPEGRG